MNIATGEKMPSGAFGVMTDAGPGAISTDDLFSGKKVVLVSVPGIVATEIIGVEEP